MVNLHDCTQGTNIALLQQNNKIMAENLKDFKNDISEIKSDLSLIKEYILTAPQKFAEKKEFDDFKNGINTKIAWVSGGLFVAGSVISFVLNKIF